MAEWTIRVSPDVTDPRRADRPANITVEASAISKDGQGFLELKDGDDIVLIIPPGKWYAAARSNKAEFD